METIKPTKRVQDMSAEECRERIAELMGWKHHGCSEPYCWRLDRGPQEMPVTGDFRVVVPKYTSNLNACAEFENTLTDEEYERYMTYIWAIVNGDQPRQESAPTRCERDYLSAKASHRAFAFLLTKGQ